jgi:hypothetical protein
MSKCRVVSECTHLGVLAAPDLAHNLVLFLRTPLDLEIVYITQMKPHHFHVYSWWHTTYHTHTSPAQASRSRSGTRARPSPSCHGPSLAGRCWAGRVRGRQRVQRAKGVTRARNGPRRSRVPLRLPRAAIQGAYGHGTSASARFLQFRLLSCAAMCGKHLHGQCSQRL